MLRMDRLELGHGVYYKGQHGKIILVVPQYVNPLKEPEKCGIGDELTRKMEIIKHEDGTRTVQSLWNKQLIDITELTEQNYSTKLYSYVVLLVPKKDELPKAVWLTRHEMGG